MNVTSVSDGRRPGSDKRDWKKITGLTVAIVTAPLWIPIVVLIGVAQLVRASVLYAAVWTVWIGAGRERVLFVYSNSPNWQEHVEREILPRLPANAVVLNWSQRTQWRRFSLPVLLFHAFAGNREFNPIALVFARFSFVERFRFWQAFRDAKHGNEGTLKAIQAALFERLG